MQTMKKSYWKLPESRAGSRRTTSELGQLIVAAIGSGTCQQAQGFSAAIGGSRTALIRSLRKRACFALWLLAVAGLSTFRAWGAIELLELDPQAASVTLEGSTSGAAWQEQGAGSLQSAVHGWVAVDLEAGTLQFLPGSSLAFKQTNWCQPGSNGSTTPELAVFGGQATFGSGLEVTRQVAALRNLAFDLSSSALNLSTGQFDASGLVLTVSAAPSPTLDFRQNGLVIIGGHHSLAGLSATNTSGAGTLQIAFEVQTLAFPIDLTLTCQTLSPGDTTLHFVGQLVARRGLTLVQPHLLWFRSPTDPSTLTLLWSTPYKLQSATTLDPPDWTDRAADAPLAIPLQRSRAFFRVVTP
jgi:hypothetical protein